MTDTQLYLAIGIPSLLALVNLAVILTLFSTLTSRLERMEERVTHMESSFNTRFDLIMGRLADLDTRLSVLEDRSKR